MATAKKAQVLITANASQATQTIKDLQRLALILADDIDKATKRMEAFVKAGDHANAKKVKNEINGMTTRMKSYTQAVDKDIEKQKTLAQVMADLSNTKLRDLKRALREAKAELNGMSANNPKLHQMRKDIAAIENQINKVTGAVKKQGGAWNTALKNLTAYVGMFAVFNQVKQYFTDLFRLNLQFGDQLTNIRKVALITNDEVGKLSRSLTKLDTRTSIEELNRIAYAGAKLGVQTKGGTEALAGFVRAADQVNVALKEDLGEEALTALAKIAEVSGNMDAMGVEQSMLRIGSSIFRLASTSTATSGKIVDFTNRMLAVGEQAALTTPDILALGAAVDSMALPPEVAATAFSKLVVSIRKGTLDIEKDLGITKGALKQMVEEGHGAQAIQSIFEAMGRTGNVFALDGLFKDLGSDGQRLITTMVTMGAKHGMLDRAIKESNKAFEEGTAVTVEYNMQQETAQAYMERAVNLWEKQFISADAASGPVRDIAKAWYEVTESLTSNLSFMSEVRLAITILFASIKTFLSILPNLITLVGTAGLAGAFTKLMLVLQSSAMPMFMRNIFVLTQAIAGNAAAVRLLHMRYAALSTVMKANLWGAIIAVVGLAIVKMAAFAASLNKVAAGQQAVNDVQEEGKRRALEQQESLKRLHRVMHDTTASMDLRLKAMKELNSAIPDLNARINSETGAVTENTKAWEDNFKALQEYYEVEGARAKLSELGRKKADAIIDLQKKEDAYANTNADIITTPQTSGGAFMPSQVQGNIGQAGQRAAAKSARDDAQRVFDDIVAQEEAIWKKWGSKLGSDGKPVGGGKGVGDGGNGKAEKPEDDARANISEFITKIKNFYERQITTTMEDLTAKGVEKELQDQAVHSLQQRMNAALSFAKESLVLGTKSWEEFKASMDNDLKERDDEYGQSQSRMLKDAVQSEDVAKLRSDLLKQMPKIKKGKIVGEKSDESDRAYMDRLWLEASKGEQKYAAIDQKYMEKRRKELLEHNYTGTVQENSFLGLVTTGFADVDVNNLKADKQAVIALLEKARTEISGIYATNGDKDKLLRFLFGEDYEKTPQQFLGLLTESEGDVQLFYQKLLQYSDEYTQAQKKQYDEQKKVVEMQWKLSGRDKSQADRQRELNRFNSIYGEQNTFSSALGFSNKAYDPEVESYKLKLQLAKEYYEYVMETSNNAQLQKEAEMSVLEAQNALTEKMVSAMKERMNKVREFAQPIVDFGAAAGEALGQMTDDVESAQEAMKNAVKSMLKSWGQMMINNFVGQMTQSMNNVQAKKISDAQTATTPFTSAPTPDMAVEMTAGTSPDDPLYVSVTNGALGEGNTGGTSAEGGNATVTVGARNGGEGGESGGRSSIVRAGKETASDAVTQAMSGGDMNTLAASVLGSGVTAALNTPIGGKSDKSSKQQAKDAKKQIQDAQKQQKDLTNIAEQGEKSRTRIEQQGTSERSDIQENGAKIEQQVATAAGSALLSSAMATQQQETAIEGAGTQVRTQMSIVEAMAKCFAFLGPIAGPIAASAVQALLMGLLNWAISAAFGGSSESSSSSTPSTKLVSGMLTYDKGNLQQLYIGNDGRIYSAQEQREGLSTGIVDHPIATTVNGQPALVGEQGPELVVGRETTAAMMHNAPQLLQMLLQFDKNRTMQGMGGSMGLFDAGNVQQVLGEQNIGNSTQDNAALVSVLAQMHTLLQTLNRDGVKAQMNMYGRNGAYSQMQRATTFMKGR